MKRLACLISGLLLCFAVLLGACAKTPASSTWFPKEGKAVLSEVLEVGEGYAPLENFTVEFIKAERPAEDDPHYDDYIRGRYISDNEGNYYTVTFAMTVNGETEQQICYTGVSFVSDHDLRQLYGSGLEFFGKKYLFTAQLPKDGSLSFRDFRLYTAESGTCYLFNTEE